MGLVMRSVYPAKLLNTGHNNNCRGHAHLWGPRGNAASGIQGAQPLAAVPLIGQQVGSRSNALVGFKAAPRNNNVID